jgi:hypothetical protein
MCRPRSLWAHQLCDVQCSSRRYRQAMPRRPGPLRRLLDRLFSWRKVPAGGTRRNPGHSPDDGGVGVREPRRPRPKPRAGAGAELPPAPEQTLKLGS